MTIRNRNSRVARPTARRFEPRRRRFVRRAQEERQPGQTSQTLRRRMGDALADLFDEFGPDIYSATTLALKDVILQRFQEGFEKLDSTIKEELGQRGVEESRQHIRNWTNEIVEDVNHFGLDEVAAALEDYVGTLAAEFQQPDEQEGDDLLEVQDDEPVEEVSEEDVEEVPAEEPAAEPTEPAAGGEELNLEDLGLELPAEQAAARFGPLGGRRRIAPRRRFQREAKRSNTAWKDDFAEDEFEDEEDRPSEDDAYMTPAGRLGSQIDLSIEGKYIGTFRSEEEAVAEVRQWAQESNFYPNLWFIDDHGGTEGPVPY